MRPKTYTIDRPQTSADTDYFSAGLPASVNTFEVDYKMPTGSYSYPVTIKNIGAVDLSSFDATITGQDIYGQDLVETIDLTTAAGTATTDGLFSSISRIDTDITGVADTQGYDPTVDISANVTALELISAGTMDIAVDGAAAVKITGLDFNGVSTVAEIATVLETALSALAVTVTEASDIITITSDSTGATSTVEVTTGTGAGTNVIGSGYIEMGTAVDGADATQGNMPTVDISANVAGIAAVSDGKLDITIDGVLTQVESLDFSGDASTADVAATLVTALSALDVTITESSDIITFTSDSSGATSTIVVAAGTAAGGTNIVDTGLIVMGTAVDGVDATSGKDVTVDISGNVTDIELVSYGTLDIAIDGGTATKVTGIDLNGVTDVADVAVALATALSALPIVVSEASDIIRFTSNTTGSTSSVEVTTGTGAGTNIVDTGLIVMGTAVDGVDDEILEVGYAVSSNDQHGIPCNWRGRNLQLAVTPGTGATYTVQFSNSSIIPYEVPVWYSVDDTDLVSATAAQSMILTVPPVMLRVLLNTAGSTDTTLTLNTTDV